MKQTVDPEKEILPTNHEIEMMQEKIYQTFVNAIIEQRSQCGFSINKAASYCSIGRKELRNYECLDCNIGLNQWCKIFASNLLYIQVNHLEVMEDITQFFYKII